MSTQTRHPDTDRRSSARGEILVGVLLLVIGLAMRFPLSGLDIPMVDVARTGEVMACIGVICLVYGGYLAVRRS